MSYIRTKGKRLYIRVRVNGTQFEISTKQNDTKRGRAIVRGMQAEIDQAVLDGTFDLNEYRGIRSSGTFMDYAQGWIDSIRPVRAYSTITEYE